MEIRELVRRAPSASPCSALDLDDVQSRECLKENRRYTLVEQMKVPGWSKLEKHARSMWGDGDWSIVINPAGVRTVKTFDL